VTDGMEGNPNAGFGSCVPIDAGQPGECRLDSRYDNCKPGEVCVNGDAVSNGYRCMPMTGSFGTRFGCCKSPPVAVDDPNESAVEGNPSVINPLPNDYDEDMLKLYTLF